RFAPARRAAPGRLTAGERPSTVDNSIRPPRPPETPRMPPSDDAVTPQPPTGGAASPTDPRPPPAQSAAPAAPPAAGAITAAPAPAPPVDAAVVFRQRVRVLDGALAAVVLLLAFAVALFPARNSDLLMNLAAGRLLAQGQYHFGVDPFAFT